MIKVTDVPRAAETRTFWLQLEVVLDTHDAALADYLVQRHGDVRVRLEHLLLQELPRCDVECLVRSAIKTNFIFG